MKYCTHCGSGNTDEAAYCAQCGAQLGSNQVSPSQTDIGSVPEIPPVPEVPRPESFGERGQYDQSQYDQGQYSQPQYDQPQPPPVQQVPVQTVYTQPYTAPPVVDKGNSVLWLVLNIVLAVLCCCTVFGSLVAIIGIVFAAMSISKYNGGFADTGKQYEKVAMILFFVALGVGIVVAVVGVINGGYNRFDNYYSDFFDY